MGFMVGLGGRIHVVVAHDVADGQAADPNRPDRCERHRPRAIVQGRNPFHRGQNMQPCFRVRLAFFVAHRPHKDARMVAIASHQVRELAQAFGIRGHHAGLIEHQHTQFVAGIEQLRRRRVCATCGRRYSPSPEASGHGNTALRPATPRPAPRGPGGYRFPLR